MKQTSEYRYTTQPYKGKSTRYPCPACGVPYKFRRYIDSNTGWHLPEIYGICNRADKCGYRLSPYDKDSNGMSYALQMWEQERGTRSNMASHTAYKPTPRPFVPQPIYALPDELRQQSLGHYDQNQFAKLLQAHFGWGQADELLTCFQIGTSAYWGGACVFWFIDEQGRTRGGQVVLFEPDGHTAYRKEERCTRWVHTALLERYYQRKEARPDWLTTYAQNGQKAPCLFGLSQLGSVSPTKPVALVEAPKTAVLCSRYYPGFVWLAVGAKDWLNAERLAPIQGRAITLFPDHAAYTDWNRKAEAFRSQGFQIQTSDYLERQPVPPELKSGYDLADVILLKSRGYPPSWDAAA